MAKGKTRATVRITWVKDLCGTKIVEQRTQGVLSDTCHPLHDGERKLFAGDCADLQHLFFTGRQAIDACADHSLEGCRQRRRMPASWPKVMRLRRPSKILLCTRDRTSSFSKRSYRLLGPIGHMRNDLVEV